MSLSLQLSMCRSAAAGPHVIAEQELVRGEGSKAWQGKAWQGMAGKGVESNAGREGSGKQGKATRLGNKARQGKARQGSKARQQSRAGQGNAGQLHSTHRFCHLFGGWVILSSSMVLVRNPATDWWIG